MRCGAVRASGVRSAPWGSRRLTAGHSVVCCTMRAVCCMLSVACRMLHVICRCRFPPRARATVQPPPPLVTIIPRGAVGVRRTRYKQTNKQTNEQTPLQLATHGRYADGDTFHGRAADGAAEPSDGARARHGPGGLRTCQARLGACAEHRIHGGGTDQLAVIATVPCRTADAAQWMPVALLAASTCRTLPAAQA